MSKDRERERRWHDHAGLLWLNRAFTLAFALGLVSLIWLADHSWSSGRDSEPYVAPSQGGTVGVGETIHIWVPAGTGDSWVHLIEDGRPIEVETRRIETANGTTFQVAAPSTLGRFKVQVVWGDGQLFREYVGTSEDVQPRRSRPVQVRARLHPDTANHAQRDDLILDQEAAVYAVAWAKSREEYRKGRRELQLVPAGRPGDYSTDWPSEYPVIHIGQESSFHSLPPLDEDAVLGIATVASDGSFELPEEPVPLANTPRRIYELPLLHMWQAFFNALILMLYLLNRVDALALIRRVGVPVLAGTFVAASVVAVAIVYEYLPLSAEGHALIVCSVAGLSLGLILRKYELDAHDNEAAPNLPAAAMANQRPAQLRAWLHGTLAFAATATGLGALWLA